VEFGARSESTEGWFGACFTASSRNAPSLPCVEAYYLRRTRFETVAQRKVRRRRLTEVEISRRGSPLLDGKSRVHQVFLSLPQSSHGRPSADALDAG
jgi:hypothetical protein